MYDIRNLNIWKQEDRRQNRNRGSRSGAEILALVEQCQEESRMRSSAAKAADPAIRRVIPEGVRLPQ